MELVSSTWGVSKTFDLPLVTYGGTDYVTGVTLATGDVKISKDGGGFENTDILPTINGAWIEVTLSATEMEASRIKVQIIDQTATKIFEDTGAILNTVLEATVAKETTLNTHEASRATMETNLTTEHGLLESGISNIGSGISRIQTSLVDQVLVPSGNNWVKVVVLVNDNTGALFDPADIVDPSGSPIYNGVGVKFSDIDDDQVVMYKDNVGTALDQVTLCAHAPQSNKPQILERDAHGLYYYWMNATVTGNALPVGQLKTVFGMFDITQTNAIYSGESPFLIQDTDPSSHLHILFAITVSTETGTNERLDDIIEDISEHETARATMQTRLEGTGYDPAQNSLKNIKDKIG
ncbi:hypothetical protein KAR91_28835 [Candidatus Pacearchaeota archaeon]|nr:hypothetical protein [Candidatus Pacearchaeota archaeon]